MKRVALGLLGLSLAAVPVAGQVAAIQTRRVMSLGDDDGPGSIATAAHVFARMSDGRILVAPTNELPMVFDGKGKFIKTLGRRGEGPGEFGGYVGLILVVRGDTVFVSSGTRTSVLDPSLKFVRAMQVGNGYGRFVPVGSGYVLSSSVYGRPGQISTRLSIVDSANHVVRSFAPETAARNVMPRGFTVATADATHFWAIEGQRSYRIERWSTLGEREVMMDKAPGWWPVSTAEPGPFGPVLGPLRQVGGTLWVIGNLPVSGYRKYLPTGRGEVSPKEIPMELIYNSYLQVYDIATRKLLAEQKIPGYVTGFLDDTHFMRYAVDSKDIPRMEVWEMTIKP